MEEGPTEGAVELSWARSAGDVHEADAAAREGGGGRGQIGGRLCRLVGGTEGLEVAAVLEEKAARPEAGVVALSVAGGHAAADVSTSAAADSTSLGRGPGEEEVG